MRKQGASIFVYLIFCLLIAIFVINFRPGQSRQNDDSGCSGTSNVVLNVDGTESTQTAFKMAYSSPYNWGTQKSKVHIALETLIRRELLASEADKRGLIVTEDLIMEEIKKGRFYSATPPPPGQSEDVEAIYRPIRKVIQGVFDQDGLWNIKAYKGWVAQLNISQNAYIEEQRRSMLAAMMADILTESVQVSKEEALKQWRFENDTATYDAVAFKPETYRSALRMTEADVDRYLKDHGDDVSARYKTDERTYKGTKPALKLRQIFIAKAEPKAEDKKPDDKKSDDKKPADKTADKKPADDKKQPAVKPVGMPIDEAKAKLEAVRTAGAKKFADAAKELNTDANAKSVAGDIGWHSVDNAALGDKAVNDAVKALKVGEMTPVVVTDKGAFLLVAEDKREGDLSFDQVKREIAWEMSKDAYGKEAAKRAALTALAEAQGKTLDKLYDKEAPAPGGMDLEQLLEDPNIPEDQKAKLRQIIQQQKHGSLEVKDTGDRDIPAGWFETQQQAGSAAVPTAPAGSAAPPAAPTPAPAGSATVPTTPAGSAATPAGAGSAAPTPVTPPAPPAELTPSKDQLPAMSDVPKPHINRFGPSARAKQMPGLGQSKEAIDAVYGGDLHAGDLAKKVYEAEGAFVVIQLVDRKTPNVKDFDKDADRRTAELRIVRANAFLDDWMRSKCEALAKDSKIKPNHELLVERDDQGKVLPVTYKPCMSFH
jgi:parvulin-like peptidyl-prolyl isomerase